MTSADFRNKIARPLRNSALKSLRFAFGLLPLKALSVVLEAALKALHAKGPNWITQHRRPKRQDAPYYVHQDAVVAGRMPKSAIVVQGPIATDDDFTIASLDYYRRANPGAVIVLSTWNDTPAELLKRCEAAGAVVVVSPKPTIAGALNVNYQSISSLAGLRKAKELGCEYGLKVRSDIRIHAPNAAGFLYDLLQTFPLRNSPRQRARIVSTTYLTSKYCPYHLSDQILYGQIDDMLRYWEPPLNKYAGPKPEVAGLIKDSVAEQVPEIYLCRSYCEGLGRPTSMSLRAWWEALADCFLVIDRDLIDAYWPKYGPHVEHPAITLELHPAWTGLYFRDWLRLYRELTPESDVPERLLELPVRLADATAGQPALAAVEHG
jgi:hypothetical protein